MQVLLVLSVQLLRLRGIDVDFLAPLLVVLDAVRLAKYWVHGVDHGHVLDHIAMEVGRLLDELLVVHVLLGFNGPQVPNEPVLYLDLLQLLRLLLIRLRRLSHWLGR